MASNVRKQMRRPQAVRFTKSPLEVYDLPLWDPLCDFDDEVRIPYTLDLEELKALAVGTHDILKKYDIEYTPPVPGNRVEGEEVGDDRLDLSLDSCRLATCLCVQSEVTGMVTSWSDTNLSDDIWNLCEVSSGIPTAKEQSFHYCRKTGNFKNLGFTDVPPLRIILDVAKGDRSHSSTASGKASMLGGRMRTPNTTLLQGWFLASYLQDGMLRTSRSSEPKYLPQIMGGSGCRAAFGSSENLYLSVLAYRGGKYSRVYGTATAELRSCLDLLERDQASMPVLCHRLRDKQEYLHGTYANQVFIPERSWMDRERGTLPAPLIMASGGANRFSAFENRLIRTKHVLDRTSAEREWSFTGRIRAQLLNGNTIPETEAFSKDLRSQGRARFGMALNANAAFSNLLNRDATIKDVQALLKEEFLIVNTGVIAFTKWDAEWLFNGGKSERYSIDDLTTVQDLFLRTEVSEEETFKVGGLLLRPIVGNVVKHTTTVAKVGLYQINDDMYEWAQRHTDSLVSFREATGEPLTPEQAHAIYEKDMEWVNDDSSLIAKCLRETEAVHMRSARVILVSSDRRLANQMANTCSVRVYVVSPRDYILWSKREGYDFQSLDIEAGIVASWFKTSGSKDPFRSIYLDSGSIAAAAAILQPDETGNGRIYQRVPVSTAGRLDGNLRSSTYLLYPLEISEHLEYVLYQPIHQSKRFRSSEGTLAMSPIRANAARRASQASTLDSATRMKYSYKR
jgi:hypothetical protein